jgi:hypothetical protein
MRDFANQCIDMAQVILSHHLPSIQENGHILPLEGDATFAEEAGHAAFALGEYYRATQQVKMGKQDLIQLAAQLIAAQFEQKTPSAGIAYAALGLLSFGPSQDRNLVWLQLDDAVRQSIRAQLSPAPASNEASLTPYELSIEIAKSVARHSLGLVGKDDTSHLIDRFLNAIQSSSTGGYCDDGKGEMGVYDISGVFSFILIRQSLQLHANVLLKDRKLPALRTFAEKYLKLIPDMVREDGLGWAYGRGIGAYGQMHCISLVLQGMRDGWVPESQKGAYLDAIRRLFQYFFITYLDQEHGFLVIQDAERNSWSEHSIRMASFDAARYLAQWSRLAKSIGDVGEPLVLPSKPVARYVCFTKTSRKEHGLFVYKDPVSGLEFQLPLTGSGTRGISDSLAFPHAPGILDWPVGTYLPAFVPELTFGEHVVVPCFYGMNCTTRLGLRNAFIFSYDQPELITKDEAIVPGLGSCKVNWSFQGGKFSGEFAFMVKSVVELTSLRYAIPLSAPHSVYGGAVQVFLGEESLRANVEQDDFQSTWEDLHVVSEDPAYRTYNGKIHYLQILSRQHPLVMRPGQVYKLKMSFEPHLLKAGA